MRRWVTETVRLEPLSAASDPHTAVSEHVSPVARSGTHFYRPLAGFGMDGQRVLVTGGAGFIGSTLANRLSVTNDVVVVDDCYLGTPENLESAVTFNERSVLDDDLPTDVDVVFHCAALSSYPMHESDPTRGVRVNVEGFVNVVEQARADGCDTVVYASSSSVYGSRSEPTTETAPVAANSGYEASKLARERYAEYFSHHYGLSLAGMRLFSVYQGYGAAEGHKGEYANLVAQFVDDITTGERPVIYGDGTQTRDFIHVEDVVAALRSAAEVALDGVYNVGTGDRYSLNDLVDKINETVGTDIRPKYVENPIPEDVYVTDTCADCSKLRSETNWEPTVGFDEGVKRVCEQYR